MWWLLPAAGLVLLVALLISATAVPWLTGRLATRAESRQATARGELTAGVVDLIEGAPELVVMGATDGQLARIDASDGVLRSIARRGAGTTGIGLGLTTALAGLASWGALTLGVHATHAGSLNGALLAVLALVPLAAFELVSPLPAATQALQRSRVAAGRVFDAMDAPPAVVDPDFPLPVGDGPHALGAARRVGLLPRRRAPGSAWRRPGAAAGPARGRWSGRAAPASRRSPTCSCASCRSTPGTRPSTGRRWSGSPQTTCDASWAWSSRIPTSSTPPWPRTSGSAGARPATTSWPTSSPASASAAGWPGLPKGLATEVGSMGARLSGGQRQRVAVARALLADFPILVLDEPAEHLDAAAADALTADLLALTEGRSTLFITHRLTGLERVDEIVVLDGGRVVERGTHTDLLASGGRYAGLWWEERMSDRPIHDEPSPDSASPGGLEDGHHRRERHTVNLDLARWQFAIDEHLPLPLRPRDDRVGLPGGPAPDLVVPQRGRDLPQASPASSARCCSSTSPSAS